MAAVAGQEGAMMAGVARVISMGWLKFVLRNVIGLGTSVRKYSTKVGPSCVEYPRHLMLESWVKACG